MPCILYIYTHKRAGLQACGRAKVDKIEFKRGVISVRACSVKRAGVEWQSYKARLLYWIVIFRNALELKYIFSYNMMRYIAPGI